MTKVIQLIDSLDAGGAERLAVTYANMLVKEIDGSFLCTTRKEGLLKSSLKEEVGYLFLNKKSSLDFAALRRFNHYLNENEIKIVHAHATSFFFASLVKCFNPKLKIIWHDHYGNSEQLTKRPKLVLKICSLLFNQIFCVNQILVKWSQKHLWCKNIEFIQNIVVLEEVDPITKLSGLDGKRILCLANLRPQKDHLNLFKAFQRVFVTNTDWTLHCVGKDFEDAYSTSIRQFVNEKKLNNSIYFYGSKPDIKNIISQTEIGVLSSKSEGLPIAMLEYGLGNLAVIATNVGDCRQVLDSNELGILVEPENYEELSDAFTYYIDNPKQRKTVSVNFNKKVKEAYSKESIIEKLKMYYYK
ncbi:glycosyltransferase [Winogradskyella sp. A2]|uniref:glycosyltransferase n=1 Tax=Winogradskyella sp. A2 TaxID=3366944 RepID=UPI00398C5716